MSATLFHIQPAVEYNALCYSEWTPLFSMFPNLPTGIFCFPFCSPFLPPSPLALSLSLSCSDPILIAQALQDYYPGDCRFIPIRQGQLIYVYAMLRGRGNLFWAGSVG